MRIEKQGLTKDFEGWLAGWLARHTQDLDTARVKELANSKR